MRKPGIALLVTITVLSLVLSACSGSSGGETRGDSAAGTGQETRAPELPVVTTLQAEQAVADAMLISGLALFLVFRAEEGASSTSNEDGTLKLEWDEQADFNSGAGMYTITMREYMIPEDDPFGADYNGYVVSGTVVTGSSDGVAATMAMDLQMSHADAENFPVQSLRLQIQSADMQDENTTAGSVTVNGHEMNIADLAQALGS